MKKLFRPAMVCAALMGCLAACPAAWLIPAQARTLTSKITELDRIPRLRPEFQVPDEPDMLFYIERSSNANTVVYAAKRDASGTIDARTPVEAFWRWFNVDGKKKELNFIERLMAYGVTADPVRPGQPVTFKIAALPERTLTLARNDAGRPEALIQIGAHTVRLSYVYLEVVDGGLMPSIPSLDIFGTDTASGKAIHEHIVQN